MKKKIGLERNFGIIILHYYLLGDCLYLGKSGALLPQAHLRNSQGLKYLEISKSAPFRKENNR